MIEIAHELQSEASHSSQPSPNTESRATAAAIQSTLPPSHTKRASQTGHSPADGQSAGTPGKPSGSSPADSKEHVAPLECGAGAEAGPPKRSKKKKAIESSEGARAGSGLPERSSRSGMGGKCPCSVALALAGRLVLGMADVARLRGGGYAVGWWLALSFSLGRAVAPRSDGNIGELLQGVGQWDLDPCCILGREHGASGVPGPVSAPFHAGQLFDLSHIRFGMWCGETLLRCEQRGACLASCGSVPRSPPRRRATHVPVFRPALAPSFRGRTSVSGALLIGTWNHAHPRLDRAKRGERGSGQRSGTRRGAKRETARFARRSRLASAGFDGLRGT